MMIELKRIDENAPLWEPFMEQCHQLYSTISWLLSFYSIYFFSSMFSFLFVPSFALCDRVQNNQHTLHIKNFIYRFSPSIYVSMFRSQSVCFFLLLHCLFHIFNFQKIGGRESQSETQKKYKKNIQIYCKSVFCYLYVVYSTISSCLPLFLVPSILFLCKSVISIQLHWQTVYWPVC